MTSARDAAIVRAALGATATDRNASDEGTIVTEVYFNLQTFLAALEAEALVLVDAQRSEETAMTNETLRPLCCWSCGGHPQMSADKIVWCGCGAGPHRWDRWNTRALGPALDTVIEAVERDGDDDEMTFGGFTWSKGYVQRFLRALRAEQTAETEGGS